VNRIAPPGEKPVSFVRCLDKNDVNYDNGTYAMRSSPSNLLARGDRVIIIRNGCRQESLATIVGGFKGGRNQMVLIKYDSHVGNRLVKKRCLVLASKYWYVKKSTASTAVPHPQSDPAVACSSTSTQRYTGEILGK
jgi:hypothetical protein